MGVPFKAEAPLNKHFSKRYLIKQPLKEHHRKSVTEKPAPKKKINIIKFPEENTEKVPFGYCKRPPKIKLLINVGTHCIKVEIIVYSLIKYTN